ncbi:unnamed protein product [Acanthosepion pharaonis]|uniref:Uncharacterized protein n=1 Tax=Acanthosepion pharaonis TaxID=158019 RepID=A0A812ER70_ACAPH|nr:unnamed protein product [Sepia pharaonis]
MVIEIPFRAVTAVPGSENPRRSRGFTIESLIGTDLERNNKRDSVCSQPAHHHPPLPPPPPPPPVGHVSSNGALTSPLLPLGANSLSSSSSSASSPSSSSSSLSSSSVSPNGNHHTASSGGPVTSTSLTTSFSNPVGATGTTGSSAGLHYPLKCVQNTEDYYRGTASGFTPVRLCNHPLGSAVTVAAAAAAAAAAGTAPTWTGVLPPTSPAAAAAAAAAMGPVNMSLYRDHTLFNPWMFARCAGYLGHRYPVIYVVRETSRDYSRISTGQQAYHSAHIGNSMSLFGHYWFIPGLCETLGFMNEIHGLGETLAFINEIHWFGETLRFPERDPRARRNARAFLNDNHVLRETLGFPERKRGFLERDPLARRNVMAFE